MPFTCKIIPPGDVIERSFSLEPDDVNVVSIKIEVSGRPSTKLDHLLFEIVKPPIGATQRKVLTTNPGSITPVTQDFGNWTISHLGNGKFKALPVGTAKPTRFMLHDVEVINEPGRAEIQVTEVSKDGAKDKQKLSIRLIEPHLRIDHFRASPAATTSKNGAELSWATTAATHVELIGPDGAPVKDGQVAINGVNSLDQGHNDHQVSVFPATTSAYTLKASSGAVDAMAFQQVTVTVTDQARAKRFDIEAPANENEALYNAFHGNGSVPPGLIAMWSGSIDQLPVGWVLCDGNESSFVLCRDGKKRRVPDLRDRFVVGAGESYRVNAKGGANENTLRVKHLPAHSHSASIGGAGAHAHDIEGGGAKGLAKRHRRYAGRTSVDMWWGGGSNADKNKKEWRGMVNTSTYTGHSHPVSVGNTGQGESIENRPPWLALAYIMKL